MGEGWIQMLCWLLPGFTSYGTNDHKVDGLQQFILMSEKEKIKTISRAVVPPKALREMTEWRWQRAFKDKTSPSWLICSRFITGLETLKFLDCCMAKPCVFNHLVSKL